MGIKEGLEGIMIWDDGKTEKSRESNTLTGSDEDRASGSEESDSQPSEREAC